MGYRSEVAIAIRKGDYEDLLNKAEKENREDVLNLIEYGDITIGEHIVVLHWDWIKWYPEFSDVKFIEHFLYNLDDNEHSYRIIKVGESYDDIDDTDMVYNNDFSCSDALGFSRLIDINI